MLYFPKKRFATEMKRELFKAFYSYSLVLMVTEQKKSSHGWIDFEDKGRNTYITTTAVTAVRSPEADVPSAGRRQPCEGQEKNLLCKSVQKSLSFRRRRCSKERHFYKSAIRSTRCRRNFVATAHLRYWKNGKNARNMRGVVGNWLQITENGKREGINPFLWLPVWRELNHWFCWLLNFPKRRTPAWGGEDVMASW